MNIELLNRIKKNHLDIPLVKKPRSNDFAGVYLHSNSPFLKEKHEGSIRSFRLYSQYEYPLYLFISTDAITEDLEYICKNYGDIKVIIIPTLRNIYEFNEFSINNLLHLINPEHNDLLYLQEDSGFIKIGFEELTEGCSWLGSSWKERIRIRLNDNYLKWTQIGNGGHNFRKRDKCLEVLNLVNEMGGQYNIVDGLEIEGKTRTMGGFLAEDAFFCGFGFHYGIFNPVTIEHANKFALEPITFKQYLDVKEGLTEFPKGFHRIDE